MNHDPARKCSTPEAEEDFAAWVAIDWADKKHVWALQETGSSRRQQGEIEASPEAVDAWVSELLLRFPGRRIAVALEQKRGAPVVSVKQVCRAGAVPGASRHGEPHAGRAVPV